MKYWEVRSELDTGYKTFVLKNDSDDYCKKYIFEYKSGIRTNGEYDGEKIKPFVANERHCDFPKMWCPSEPMLSKQAKECLATLLGDGIELIEFLDGEDKYYIMNVLNTLDAIYYKDSRFEYMRGRRYSIKKVSFQKEIVESHDIFRIYFEDHIYSTKLFVSDRFKNIVEENDLKGFEFIEVPCV